MEWREEQLLRQAAIEQPQLLSENVGIFTINYYDKNIHQQNAQLSNFIAHGICGQRVNEDENGLSIARKHPENESALMHKYRA